MKQVNSQIRLQTIQVVHIRDSMISNHFRKYDSGVLNKAKIKFIASSRTDRYLPSQYCQSKNDPLPIECLTMFDLRCWSLRGHFYEGAV